MQKVIELLKRNNINYIVSVDDCYATDAVTADIKFLILDDMTTNTHKYSKVLQREGLYFIIDIPEHLRRKEISDFLDRSEGEKTDELTELYKSCVEENNEKKGLITQRDSLITFLNSLKDSNAINDYKTFSSTEDASKFLNDQIDTLWNPNDGNRILWLIDRDFSLAGGDKDGGLNFLSQFIDKKWNISILASQNTANISTGNELYEYLKGLDPLWAENINLAWLVDKDYLSSDKSDELAKEIAHGLRRNYSYWIADYLVENLNFGLNEAKSKFKSIEQPTINNIVLNFSNKEGVSLVETLLRVLLIYTKEDLNKALKGKLEDINKLIRDYENLCEGISEEEILDDKKVIDIRRKEKYNEWVNKLYYPVGFGDIFEINGELYLLVSQPCDIALRGSEDRKIDNGLLLKISNEKPQGSSNDNKHKTFAELKYFKPGDPHYVLYKDSLQIDFNILDLCSTNDKGLAQATLDVIKYGIGNDPNFSKSLRFRLDKVLKIINEQYLCRTFCEDRLNHIENYILFKCKSKKKEELKTYLDEYKKSQAEYWNNNLTIQNFLIKEGNLLYYNVNRVCRLDELTTTSICVEFSGHNSRIGLQGDFAHEYEQSMYTIKLDNPMCLFDKSADATICVADKYIVHNKTAISSAFKEFVFPLVESAAADASSYQIDARSVVNKSEKEKCITIKELPASIKNTKSFCWISSRGIQLPIQIFIDYCPKLIGLIHDRLNDFDFLKDNKLLRFWNDNIKGLNEFVLFDKKEIVLEDTKGIIQIVIDKKEAAKISFSVDVSGGTIYEVDLNIEEAF